MSEKYPDNGRIEQKSSLSFYNKEINPYEFVSNAYYGSGGFLNGDYLWKHPKERKFEDRKAQAFYKNYVRPIIDSVITPVFAKPAIRETNNIFFQQFIKDVDVKGTPIQDFTKEVVKNVKLHGSCFAIMDNMGITEGSSDDVLNGRAYPYLIMRTADQVEEYQLDEWGNLESIMFDYGTVKIKDKIKELYIHITDESAQLMIEEDDKYLPYGNEILHGLGVIPVIRLAINNANFLPFPPVYDMAVLNRTIYNRDSEQRNLERKCAFPLLTMQAKDYQGEVTLAEDSIIIYGGDYDSSVTAPSWIAPPVDILKTLDEMSSNLTEKMIELANVNGATAISTGSGTKSGVALAFEFIGQSYSLKENVSLAEQFEYLVADLFGKFMNSVIDYNVKYSDNFAPSVSEILLKIDMLSKAISLGINLDAEELDKLKSLIISSI